MKLGPNKRIPINNVDMFIICLNFLEENAIKTSIPGANMIPTKIKWLKMMCLFHFVSCYVLFSCDVSAM